MPASPVAPSDPMAINAVLVASRQAVDAICDRWTLTLIVAALQGARRYGEFTEQTGMASRLLTARLRTLEDQGLLSRLPYSLRPPRDEYRLTPKSEALFEVVLQMARWEDAWRDGSGLPIRHGADGHVLRARLCCRACGLPAGARDIDLKVSAGQLRRLPDKAGHHRRSTVSSETAGAAPGALGPALDIFGDKWGIEILLCAFSRLRRFVDFRRHTGIAANILTDRLERLTAAGVLARQAEGAPRAGYRLTEKGIDLYGIIVAIQDWADAWLPERYRSPVRLIHRGCGAVFHPMSQCLVCELPVGPSQVRFIPA